jgi:ADP-ribose pyrophosphatase
MIRDEIDPQPVTEASIVHEGRIFDLVRESVNLGEAGVVTREYIDHPGAVAVIALDDRERILLLRQYRQPVGAYLWEPPAGLLDIPGEPTQVAAARELYEEADLRADSWQVLVVFLARGHHEVSAAERHVREDEEIGMESRWVEIDDAVNLVLSGQIHNPSAVVGILAVSAARDRHWTTLRSVDEAFPFRRTQKASERI